MNEWFRSWHGAPTDPKWLGIAKRAGVAPGIAVAVAWALMDRASQAADRGSIEGYDADGLACFYGCEASEVDAIVAAMTDKGMIADGRFAAWSKRQPKREDNSADRVKAYRERAVTHQPAAETQCNAPKRNVTLDTDTDTEKKEGGGGGSAGARETPTISQEAFAIVDEVLAAASLDSEHPLAIGGAYQVQAWVNEGIPLEIIRIGCKRALANKRDGPPKSWRYFRDAVAREHALAADPLPVVTVDAAKPMSVSARNNPRDQRKQEWYDALAELKAHNLAVHDTGGTPDGVLRGPGRGRLESVHHRDNRPDDGLFGPDRRESSERRPGHTGEVQVLSSHRRN
jgi:hypothetical protein